MNIISIVTLLGILVGSSVTTAIGKTETKDNLVLHVDQQDGGKKHVFLDGYTFMNYDKVSIEADLTTADDGTITSAENIKIVGIASKITKVTGTLTDAAADILLQGKALAFFDFNIHYTAAK